MGKKQPEKRAEVVALMEALKQSLEPPPSKGDALRAEVADLKAKVAALLHDVEDATAFVTEVALAFGCEPDDPGLLALVKEAAPKKTGGG